MFVYLTFRFRVCEVAVPLRTRGALLTPDYFTHDPNDRRSGRYDFVCACLNVDLMGLSCEVSSRAGRSIKIFNFDSNLSLMSGEP